MAEKKGEPVYTLWTDAATCWTVYLGKRVFYTGQQFSTLVEFLKQHPDLPIKEATIYDAFDVLDYLNAEAVESLTLISDRVDLRLTERPRVNRFPRLNKYATCDKVRVWLATGTP